MNLIQQYTIFDDLKKSVNVIVMIFLLNFFHPIICCHRFNILYIPHSLVFISFKLYMASTLTKVYRCEITPEIKVSARANSHCCGLLTYRTERKLYPKTQVSVKLHLLIKRYKKGNTHLNFIYMSDVELNCGGKKRNSSILEILF